MSASGSYVIRVITCQFRRNLGSRRHTFRALTNYLARHCTIEGIVDPSRFLVANLARVCLPDVFAAELERLSGQERRAIGQTESRRAISRRGYGVCARGDER